jgi:hypothetical protein
MNPARRRDDPDIPPIFSEDGPQRLIEMLAVAQRRTPS